MRTNKIFRPALWIPVAFLLVAMLAVAVYAQGGPPGDRAAGAGLGCPSCPAAGQGPGAAQGPRHHGRGGHGGCVQLAPDVTLTTTATGLVSAFTGGPGVGVPLLTLTVNGEALSLVASPYYVWMSSAFLPQPGREMTVTYAPVNRDGETFLVALSVTDVATGLTVVLRDPETGRPVGWPG